MKNKAQKKQSMLNGAAVLMVSAVFVKIIGFLFKVPLTDMLGTVGRGYFNAAYEIYTPIFAIAMAGLPVAVSRMVAENVATERFRQARLIYKLSKKLFLTMGIIGTVLMLVAAYPYCLITGDSTLRTLPALLLIAPSVFFCCYLSGYRGYYEGLRNMTPTAVSQVIEALGKLILGIAFIKLFQTIGTGQYESQMAAGNAAAVVFGTEVRTETEFNSVMAPWLAAGGVLGVTFGSALGSVFLMLYYRVKGDGLTRAQLVNSPKPVQGNVIVKKLIAIAVPMVIGSLISNITNLIDTVTIQARIGSAVQNEEGFNFISQMFNASFSAAQSAERLNMTDKSEVVKYLWGAYGMALDFKNLVPTVTVQLGVSALPVLAAAWAVKNKKEIHTTVETVLRLTMIVALPAGIGMSILAKPILQLVYGTGSSADAIAIAAPVMAVLSLGTFLIAVSTPVTGMLQAIGRTDIPMKSVAVAAVAKILCNFILVGNYRINIYGAVVGTLLFYTVIVGINLFFLLRVSEVKVKWDSVFLKPMIAALACGFTAYAANGLLGLVIPAGNGASRLNGTTLSALLAIGFAVFAYAVALLFIGGIKKEDILSLPKGEKIAKVLEKYRLLG